MKGLLKEGTKVIAVVCSNPKHTQVFIHDFKRRKCHKGKKGRCQHNKGYLIESDGICRFAKTEEVES